MIQQHEAVSSTDLALPQELGSVLLRTPEGMHARPAIRLTKLAMRFRANVRVAKTEDGPWLNAKSIARVISMKVPSQRTLYFSADGEDAGHAVRALIRLVENDFKEAS
jgi:phosphocarrier protein